MLAIESANKFAELEAERNNILDNLPNHYLITPDTFTRVKGSKHMSAKELVFHLIKNLQGSVEEDKEISVAKEEEAASLEGILTMLWATTRAPTEPPIMIELGERAASHSAELLRGFEFNLGNLI